MDAPGCSGLSRNTSSSNNEKNTSSSISQDFFSGRRRVVLVCCGDFNPPTYAHFRIFERARDFLQRTMNCQVLEGIMSPLGDVTRNRQNEELSKTQKSEYTDPRPSIKHRLRMVEAAARSSNWIRAGDFHSTQSKPVKELDVLRHYHKSMRRKYGSDIRVVLLCGSDVMETFAYVDDQGNCPWTQDELETLLLHHGLIVFRRGRHHPAHTVYLLDVLRTHQKNIFLLEDETYPSTASSSRLRIALRRGESIKYCVDDSVLEYIEEHDLYDISERCSSSSSSSDTQVVSQISESEMPPPPPRSVSSERTKRIAKDENVIIAIGKEKNFKKNKSVNEAAVEETLNLCSSQTSADVMKTANVKEEVSAQCWVNQQENVALSVNVEKSKKEKPSSSPATIKLAANNFKPILSAPVPCKDSPPPQSMLPCPHSKTCNDPYLTPCRQEFCPSRIARPIPLTSSEQMTKPQWHRTKESPNYDNVSLEELLQASTSWAEYLGKEKQKITQRSARNRPDLPLPPPCLPLHSADFTPRENGRPNMQKSERIPSNGNVLKHSGQGSAMEKVQPQERAQTERSREKEKKKKKGWFFRSKSLKENTSDDETMVRICGSDRRQQGETSPEILWRKISQTASKEKWNFVPSSPWHTPENATESSIKKDIRSIRFAQQLTKSAENLHKTASVPVVDDVMSKSYCGETNDNGVTLTFRRYRLASTPETTV